MMAPISLIQLQYADEQGKYQGGLYLNVHAIAAIRFVEDHTRLPQGHRGWCKILMVNGIEYRVFQSVSDVLDAIAVANGHER